MTGPRPKTWGIVGLGWLGKPLAAHLQSQGHSAWGTHRADFDFRHDLQLERTCDVLFLNTPPLTDLPPLTYIERLALVDARRIIFVSSTSVFGQSAGVVNEQTPPSPESASAHWLLSVENLLADRFGARLTIIRPGGLIGGDRHPARSLSGRQGILGGNEKINLIHREDLIRLIALVPEGTPLVHAVAPHHPRKDDYYTTWAEKLGVAKPSFLDSPFSEREIRSCVVATFYDDWKCPFLDQL